MINASVFVPCVAISLATWINILLERGEIYSFEVNDTYATVAPRKLCHRLIVACAIDIDSCRIS